MARPRQIDRSTVLRASLKIADEDGIATVTMKAVADSLGVTPMALYRHVNNKRDLLDGLVESLLDEIPDPDSESPWDDQLKMMGRALRDSARRHPEVFPLLLQRSATTSAARQRRDRVHQALRDAGLHNDCIGPAERIVSTILLGFAASEVSGRFAGHSRTTLDEDYKALEVFITAGLATLGAKPPPR